MAAPAPEEARERRNESDARRGQQEDDKTSPRRTPPALTIVPPAEVRTRAPSDGRFDHVLSSPTDSMMSPISRKLYSKGGAAPKRARKPSPFAPNEPLPAPAAQQLHVSTKVGASRFKVEDEAEEGL